MSPLYQTGVLSGPNITPAGSQPSVKKLGLFGDYPLVIAYTAQGGSGLTTTASTGNTPTDFSWIAGNVGDPVSLSPSAYNVNLESDVAGLFINTAGASFSGLPSGQVNFWWSNGPSSGNSFTYRGPTNTPAWFPWTTTNAGCH
jgi:hypothetical protein